MQNRIKANTGSIKKILVVCTGNACRSPMAEAFLKKYLRPEDGFVVLSAGVSAISGLTPTGLAVEVMKEEQIDILPYRTKPFSRAFAQASDIILVMSGVHRDFILNEMPEANDKVFLYNEFAGIPKVNNDIEDPIGQSLSVYRSVRDQIKQATEAIVNRIRSGL